LSYCLHGFNFSVLVLERNTRVYQIEAIIWLLVHDFGEDHELEGLTSKSVHVHGSVAFKGFVEVRI